MAFKNPLKAANLKKVKGSQFVKMLAIIIARKFLDGNTVPFLILTDHQYIDFDAKKSLRHPFFLLGNRQSDWKDYHKKKRDDGTTNRQYMIQGTCRRNGNEFLLVLDGSKGLKKIPRETMKYLANLLKKINSKYTITTNAGTAGIIDETTNATKAQEVKEETKTANTQIMRDLKNSQQVTDYKKEKQDEAKNMSSIISNLRTKMDQSLRMVSRNVRKGATSGADIKRVKEVNTLFQQFVDLYKKSPKPVQDRFKKAYETLNKQKEELYRLSMAAKQSKKSVAQRLADQYYQTKEKRTATDPEVNKFQDIVKRSIDYNKKKSQYKVDQNFLLRATSYVVGRVGPERFDVQFVDQVLAKSAA